LASIGAPRRRLAARCAAVDFTSMRTDDLDINLGDMPDLPSYDASDLADMQHEKYEYDAMLDAAYEYEAGVIEKGIRAQVEERARDYLSRNGDAVRARIQRAIEEAERLVDEHPGASLICSMTAAELMVRFMLLRPMLAGLVIDPAIADRLAAEATQGLGDRDRKLLPHVCRAWGIDIVGARVNGDRELWPTLGGLWSVRHAAVHRAAERGRSPERGGAESSEDRGHRCSVGVRRAWRRPMPSGWSRRGPVLPSVFAPGTRFVPRAHLNPPTS